MFFKSLFREEADAVRAKRQRLDQLLRVSAPHEVAILIATGVVLMAFVLWAFFGSIARTTTIQGAVVAADSLQNVVVYEPGNLVNFHVSPGDEVAAGDLIAHKSVPDLERRISTLMTRIDSLKQQAVSAPEDQEISTLLDSNEAALMQLEERQTAQSQITSPSNGFVTDIFGTPGGYLPADAVIAKIRINETSKRSVVSQVTQQTASRFKEGMAAVVEIQLPDESALKLRGQIAAVKAEQPSSWLTSLLNIPRGYEYRVEINLDRPSDFPVANGALCLIRIEIGQDRPIEILGFGRS